MPASPAWPVGSSSSTSTTTAPSTPATPPPPPTPTATSPCPAPRRARSSWSKPPARTATDRWVVDQTTTNADGTVSIGVVPISPVAPVPVVPDPFSASPSTDPNTAYVQSLYKAVLGRTGADSEVAAWLVKMDGGMTRQQVAVGFVNSLEHRQDQVDAYYEEFLHRAPDPGSVIWVNELLSGVSEETVVEGDPRLARVPVGPPGPDPVHPRPLHSTSWVGRANRRGGRLAGGPGLGHQPRGGRGGLRRVAPRRSIRSWRASTRRTCTASPSR